MTRPMYETEELLANERKIADFIEQKWKCELTKLPIRYYLDFVMHRNQVAVGFCEMRTRNLPIEKIKEYGGWLVDIGKWNSAKQLSETSGLPVFFVLETSDGLYYLKTTTFKHNGVLVRGRSDRNDWQDVSPCVIIDTDLLIKIQDKKEKDWLDD